MALDWHRPDYAPIWSARVGLIRSWKENPGAVTAAKAHFAQDPVAFIEACCCTFDPRLVEIGIDATAPFLLFPRQADYVRWVVERWKSRQDGLVEKSRDMGVSWLSCAIAIWMWTFHPGVVVGFGSRKEDFVDKIGDPSSLFWKLRTLVDLMPPMMRPAGYDAKKHAPFMRLVNPENGSAIVGEAGDNIGRGARASIYFVDEAAFLERPELVDAALSQTSNCKIHVSTPNGEGNPFWRKRHGGRWPVFTFDWRDDPRKGEDWYERQKQTLDPVVLAQEVDRDYSASVGNAFIGGDIVTAAMARGPADVPAMGGLRVGLDVARFGDDKTALILRRGRVVVRLERWSKTDLMSTAGRARQIIASYVQARGVHLEQIAVDTIGLGAGVADALREWFGDAVVDVNAADRIDDGQNYNLRAAMWAGMREWLPGASLPNDHDLRADLTGLRYSYRGGLLLLESKDDAKKRGLKSPDAGDAIALTFAKPHTAKKPKSTIGSVARSSIDAELGL